MSKRIKLDPVTGKSWDDGGKFEAQAAEVLAKVDAFLATKPGLCPNCLQQMGWDESGIEVCRTQNCVMVMPRAS